MLVNSVSPGHQPVSFSEPQSTRLRLCTQSRRGPNLIYLTDGAKAIGANSLRWFELSQDKSHTVHDSMIACVLLRYQQLIGDKYCAFTASSSHSFGIPSPMMTVAQSMISALSKFNSILQTLKNRPCHHYLLQPQDHNVILHPPRPQAILFINCGSQSALQARRSLFYD